MSRRNKDNRKKARYFKCQRAGKCEGSDTCSFAVPFLALVPDEDVLDLGECQFAKALVPCIPTLPG